MPQVRDGPGAAAACHRGRGKPGTGGFSPPFPVDAAADRSSDDSGDGRPPYGIAGLAIPELDRAGLGVAHRPVGGLAVLRARYPLGGDTQSQHVDPDRRGHCFRLSLQRGGDAGAAGFSGVLRVPRWPGRRVFRSRGGDRVADPAGSDTRAARAPRPRRRSSPCSAWRRRRRGASGPKAARRMSRWRTSISATGCGCGRARRCRWTARSRKARARWTNPC